MIIAYLNSEFSERLWHKESSYLGNYGPFCPCYDYSLTLLQVSIHQNHINCGPQTRDRFYLFKEKDILYNV